MNLPTKTLYENYVLTTYARFDLEIERGSGCLVWSPDGRQLLDFGAGIAVCSLGHSHPEVAAAVAEQAARLVHTSNLYYTRPQALLAEALSGIVGTPGRNFFCNSGAEANEGLIKLARRFGHATGGRHKVLTFAGSFHGRTMACLSATGQDKVKTGFAPLLEGFAHLPFGDLGAVAAAVDDETAAILVEPVQGEGGIRPAGAAFLQGLRQLCDKHDLLLLFDEVQCGLGRTGDWCGWRSMAGDTVEPDGISWAKGIANGFPLGAFWVRDREIPGGARLPSLLGPGSHGTTYGGNPVCCAAALKVLEIIRRDNLLGNALEQGAYLREELRAIRSPFVAEVRAAGLMLGIELTADFAPGAPPAAPSLAFAKAAIGEGLLVIPSGERVVRLLPPLNVSRPEIDAALEIIRGLLEKTSCASGPEAV